MSPLPIPSPRIISTNDLVIGDAVGTPLSACEYVANLTAKDLQENIDYLFANKLTSGGGSPLSGITDIITNGPWIDVRYYGVDESNTATQNDSALTNALTAMSAGSTLFFPGGTFKFSSPITFQSNYAIRGMGREVTTLEYEGSTGTIALQNNTGIVSTDYPQLSGFTLTNTVSGFTGLDLGKCNRGIFRDITINSFIENNVLIDSTESAITNNYNMFYSIRSNNSKVGFELGQSNQNTDSNYFIGCESTSDLEAVKLVDASGCQFYGLSINDAATCFNVAGASDDNYIAADIRNSTAGGTLDSGSVNNIIKITSDGTITTIVDNGWNTTDNGSSNTGIFRTDSEKIVTRLDSGLFTSASKNVFSFEPPYNGSYKITITEAGIVTSIDNYAETKVYSITRLGNSTSVVTELHTDGSDMILTSISTGVVTFAVSGDSVQSARYQLGVEILGNGSDANGLHAYPTYTKL